MVWFLLVASLCLATVFAIYMFFNQEEHDETANVAEDASRSSTVDGLGSKRVLSEEEVSKHTTAEDLWLIIQGKVYNFTDYIALHPGGEAMLRNAGKDSTAGFSGSQHPARVWDMVSL